MGLEDGMHHRSTDYNSADDGYGVVLLGSLRYQSRGGAGVGFLLFFFVKHSIQSSTS